MKWRYSSTLFSISAQDGAEYSASCPGCFDPREEAPVPTQHKAWWVLQVVWMLQTRKTAYSQQESNHDSSFFQPKAQSPYHLIFQVDSLYHKFVHPMTNQGLNVLGIFRHSTAWYRLIYVKCLLHRIHLHYIHKVLNQLNPLSIRIIVSCKWTNQVTREILLQHLWKQISHRLNGYHQTKVP
jgi:hypothetical protein